MSAHNRFLPSRRHLPIGRYLSILLSLAMSVSFTGCSRRPFEKQPQQVEAEEEPLEFDLFHVTYREIARDIEGLGNLVFFDKATVVSRIDGVIEKILVKKGDPAQKGEKIAELSNYALELEKIKAEKEVLAAQEELETAEMQYIEEEKNLYKKFFQLEKLELQIEDYKEERDFMKENLERKRILYEKGGITEEELRNLEFSLESKKREIAILQKEYELQGHGFREKDIIDEGYAVPQEEEERRRLLIFINTKLSRKRVQFAEIRLKAVQVELERINWLLEKTIIRAPINGVITDISKFVGEKVNADEAITTILNRDKLIARVSFSESDLMRLKEGEKVTVYIDSLHAKVSGTIHTIDPYVDVKTRSFSVDCLINNSGRLIPGMFVKVTIPVQKPERFLLIPKTAFIREEDSRGYVYTVSKNDRIFKKPVIYEDFDNEFLIVTDGLKDGDIIVQNPIMNLADGMKITYKRSI